MRQTAMPKGMAVTPYRVVFLIVNGGEIEAGIADKREAAGIAAA